MTVETSGEIIIVADAVWLVGCVVFMALNIRDKNEKGFKECFVALLCSPIGALPVLAVCIIGLIVFIGEILPKFIFKILK